MEFIHWLAMLPSKKLICIECGAGEAEISQFCSQIFKLSIATDISPPKHSPRISSGSKITYLRSPAETLPVPAASVDLVVSMQALHHFEVNAHLAEADRVLRNGGVFAALAWGDIILPAIVRKEASEFLGLIEPFWESGRDWVTGGYPGLEFKGEEVETPAAMMRRTVTFQQLKKIFRSWSAYKEGLASIRDELEDSLDRIPQTKVPTFDVSWPIVGKVFRKQQLSA